MKIVRYGIDPMEFDGKTSLTVGTFDGVHSGHQGIINRMKAVAKRYDERTVVVTFEPHPQIVLQKPGRELVRLLTTIEERCALFEQLGVDVTFIIPFTKEFADTPADVFISRVIVETIGVKHFFIGHDHMFGKDRSGDEHLLQMLGQTFDFVVEPVPPLICDGVVVSSTKVRTALKEGNVEGAARMLGRPYDVTGRVVRGDGRGRALGIPTANIHLINEYKLLPGNGVYVVSSNINGIEEIGMANIGVRPTFTQDITPVLEVNYIDLDKDLYNNEITVCFHRFIRHEQKFDSKTDFLLQLESDKQQTLSFKNTFLTRS